MFMIKEFLTLSRLTVFVAQSSLGAGSLQKVLIGRVGSLTT